MIKSDGYFVSRVNMCGDNTLMSGQPESIKKFLIRNISRCNKMLLLTQGHPNTLFYTSKCFFLFGADSVDTNYAWFEGNCADISKLFDWLIQSKKWSDTNTMLRVHPFILYRSVLSGGKRFYLISKLICCSSKFSFNPA